MSYNAKPRLISAGRADGRHGCRRYGKHGALLKDIRSAGSRWRLSGATWVVFSLTDHITVLAQTPRLSKAAPTRSKPIPRCAKYIWAKRGIWQIQGKIWHPQDASDMTAPFDPEKTTPPSTTLPLSVWGNRAYYGESYIVQNVGTRVQAEIFALLIFLTALAKRPPTAHHRAAGQSELKHGRIWLNHQPLH
jgi:hypothetical protein